LRRARTADTCSSLVARGWAGPIFAVLSLVATAILAVVAENLRSGGRVVTWDSEIGAKLPMPKPSAMTTFFEVVTWAGNAFVLSGLAIVAGIWFTQRGQPARARLILAGVFAAEAIAVTLKVALHNVHPNSHAFPSGHTAGAAATYGILFYLVAGRRSSVVRVVAALMFVALVALVAFSRLYLHVHYLSDVLAGTALGIAVAAAGLCVYELGVWRRAR
jgi:membrane-associated phospholipid phosphatase